MTPARRHVLAGQSYSRRLDHLALACAFVSALYLSVLWVARYSEGNQDDKAVHYYSAARLYSSGARVAALEHARPLWLEKLPSDRRFRTDNRLSSFRTYLLPSSLLRLACEPYREGDLAPRSFALPFRNAMFLTHLLGMGLILALAARRPVAGSVGMLCLVVATIKPLTPTWLADVPDHNWHFLTYVPRCAAVLVLTAAFLAFAHRLWWKAAACLLLVFIWHAGSGAIWVPLTLGAFALTQVAARRGRKTRIVLLGGLLVLGVGVAPFLVGMEQIRLWCPLVLFGLVAARRSPPSPSTRACLATAGYLYMTQLFMAALAVPSVREALVHQSGNPLAAVIPARLEGTRQVAAIALVAVLGLRGVALLAERMGKAGKPAGEIRALLLAEAALLLLGVGLHGRTMTATLAGRRPFFRESDDHVRRIPMTAETLSTLDPDDEATFFASLGDFLIVESNANSRPRDRAARGGVSSSAAVR